jgi:hypothetical protein
MTLVLGQKCSNEFSHGLGKRSGTPGTNKRNKYIYLQELHIVQLLLIFTSRNSNQTFCFYIQTNNVHLQAGLKCDLIQQMLHVSNADVWFQWVLPLALVRAVRAVEDDGVGLVLFVVVLLDVAVSLGAVGAVMALVPSIGQPCPI